MFFFLFETVEVFPVHPEMLKIGDRGYLEQYLNLELNQSFRKALEMQENNTFSFVDVPGCYRRT